MSALPPIADIGTQSWNVRFVPMTDIGERRGGVHHARTGFGIRRRKRKCTGTYSKVGNKIINAATHKPGAIQCCASVSLKPHT